MSESTNTITTTASAPIATIASLSQHEGQTVTLRGWLYNLRASGKLLFPIFRDGTGTIQGIVPKAAVPEEVFNTLKELTLESSLTQSGQLYIEATALALGKVYSFGPTFRAEKSKTRRHLTEFWMVEPEVAFLQLDGLMDLAEAYLIHIVTTVLAHHRADLKVI